jgi:hypothetical protein
MLRRTTGLLLRLVAGLAAGLILTAVALVWRLESGPVSLDFLTPYLAREMARAESGLAVRIDHTVLSLGPGPSLDILARGVRFARASGAAQLMLPELRLELGLRDALMGRLAPTRIVLSEPALHLERSADGSFHFGLTAAESATPEWGDQLLRDVAVAPDRSGPFGRLSEIAIRDAELTVDDRALGLTWRARRVNARLFRDAAGFMGAAVIAVEEPGGKSAEISGKFRLDQEKRRIGVEVDLAALEPALFAGVTPALAPLAAAALPVSGRVSLEIDSETLRVIEASGDLAVGGGRIVQAGLVGGALDVASGGVRARYDPAQSRITVEQLSLELGGPVVALSGTIDGVGDAIFAGGWPASLDINGELKLGQVPADALPRLWPERLSPHSRRWVTEHIHDGLVSEATAQFGIHLDLSDNAAKRVDVHQFAGTMAYRGLTVEYFKPLAPLRDVDGIASFDRSRLDLTPSKGHVNDVELTGGTAKLGKLDTDDEEIAIEFGIKGPLRTVLAVLDTEPLGYARALKINPAQVGGVADGQLSFKFPLKHDLALAMVDFGARARLSGVAIKKVLAEQDLTEGELQLRLDSASLLIDGTAALAGIPATLNWFESLDSKSATRSRYRVKAELDDAARRKLGFAFLSDKLSGPVDLDATYTLLPARKATASILLDLAKASIDVAQLNWKKAPGARANAAVDLDLQNEHIRGVRRAILAGERLDARLTAALDGDGDLQRVDVSRLIAGETDVSGSLARRTDGGWRVEVKGLAFDASGLVAKLDRNPDDSSASDPPLVIDANLDRLIVGPKREARGVRGQLFSDGIHWQAMSIDATMFGGGKAALRFGESAGDRSFRLTTDDLGALLRLFDVSDNIVGGRLEITGQVEDAGRRRTFRGKLDGADYRVVGVPAFARLLSLASLSGIAALLTGEGIPFTTLKGDFVSTEGKIEVKELRAYGGALGIKVEGIYDVAGGTLDLAGTLVPAYTINSVLGNIPLLGTLLTGGEGEGVFGANFRVAGPVGDSKITVNPLSALAPGLLRKLFLFEAPEPSPAAAKTDPK